MRELKHENPFLYEIDSTALQDATERLQRAYQRHDKGLSGEPRIKTLKNPVQSFTIKNTNNSIRIKGNYIRLNKIRFHQITWFATHTGQNTNRDHLYMTKEDGMQY